MGLPTRTADRLIDELKITQNDLLYHLDEIAYARGALVVEGNLRGSEARLNMVGKPAIITLSNSVTNASRRRFSVSHELGHLELHRWQVTLCTSADMLEWSISTASETVELEANEFAASFLMPERFFQVLCEEEPSLGYFAQIADQFLVSLTSAAIRYCEFTPEPVAIVYSQDGYIKWFRASKAFQELGLFVDVHSRVYAASRAGLIFAGKFASKKPMRIPANVWLREGDYRSDYAILEQSWMMESFNGALTLLWADEEPDDSDDYFY